MATYWEREEEEALARLDSLLDKKATSHEEPLVTAVDISEEVSPREGSGSPPAIPPPRSEDPQRTSSTTPDDSADSRFVERFLEKIETKAGSSLERFLDGTIMTLDSFGYLVEEV